MLSLVRGTKPLNLCHNNKNYTLSFNVMNKGRFQGSTVFEQLVDDGYININGLIKSNLLPKDKLSIISSDTPLQNDVYDYQAYMMIKKDKTSYDVVAKPYEEFMVEQYENNLGIVIPYKLIDALDEEVIYKSVMIDAKLLKLIYGKS